MRLAFRCVVRNGIRRFQIADPSNDPARLRRVAAIAREEGVEEIVLGLTYSVSEVHTHAYYAERAAALADCAEMDRLYLKDPGRPADAGRRARAGARTSCARRATAPVELHSHCTIGLAPARLHGGPARRVPGAAHGGRAARARDVEPGGRDDAAQPRGRGLLAPARPRRARGGVRALPRARAREGAAARRRRRSTTRPTTTTSCAGGMVSTTRRMLEELRRPELFDAALEEVGRVRAEMGYPIIVTPVSQFVATQAVRNVIDAERWSNVSDETIRYFLGHYGEPAAPVDAGRRRRACSRCPRADELRHARAAQPRGRAGALRPRDLRRGAAAAADDARGAGGRDARLAVVAAGAAPPARPGAASRRDAAARGRAGGRRSRTCASQTGDDLVEWRRAT